MHLEIAAPLLSYFCSNIGYSLVVGRPEQEVHMGDPWIEMQEEPTA